MQMAPNKMLFSNMLLWEEVGKLEYLDAFMNLVPPWDGRDLQDGAEVIYSGLISGAITPLSLNSKFVRRLCASSWVSNPYYHTPSHASSIPCNRIPSNAASASTC